MWLLAVGQNELPLVVVSTSNKFHDVEEKQNLAVTLSSHLIILLRTSRYLCNGLSLDSWVFVNPFRCYKIG